jgi:hypothetical protein
MRYQSRICYFSKIEIELATMCALTDAACVPSFSNCLLAGYKNYLCYKSLTIDYRLYLTLDIETVYCRLGNGSQKE